VTNGCFQDVSARHKTRRGNEGARHDLDGILDDALILHVCDQLVGTR